MLIDAGREEPRIAAIARVYLESVDGEFLRRTFIAFIQAVQEHEPLNSTSYSTFGAFLNSLCLNRCCTKLALCCTRRPGVRSRVLHRLASLRALLHTDWAPLIEPLIVFDANCVRILPRLTTRWISKAASSIASASHSSPVTPIAPSRGRKAALDLAR